MQQKATQGLSRSPIRAAFQKVPNGPVFLLSKSEGHSPRKYAQVQINNKMVVTNAGKCKSADMVFFLYLSNLEEISDVFCVKRNFVYISAQPDQNKYCFQ